MKAQHTPGPWKFQRYSQSAEDLAEMERLGIQPTMLLANDGSAPIMANDIRVALVDCQTKFKRGEGYKTLCLEREANARLIAAAPQLLEAANAALSLLAIHGQRETPTFEALLSAIRAAKGE